MKIELKFDMNEGDDRYEFNQHIKGPNAFMALSEIQDYIYRMKWDENPTRDREQLFEMLNEALSNNGLDLERDIL